MSAHSKAKNAFLLFVAIGTAVGCKTVQKGGSEIKDTSSSSIVTCVGIPQGGKYKYKYDITYDRSTDTGLIIYGGKPESALKIKLKCWSFADGPYRCEGTQGGSTWVVTEYNFGVEIVRDGENDGKLACSFNK